MSRTQDVGGWRNIWVGWRAQWQVETEEPTGDKGAGWIDYNPDLNQQLEQLYQHRIPSMRFQPHHNFEYCLNVEDMVQTNETNGTRRIMRRMLLPE